MGTVARNAGGAEKVVFSNISLDKNENSAKIYPTFYMEVKFLKLSQTT